MDLSGMAVFARVAEARSFSAAARRLGLSKAAVSKQVARLEQDLGVRLLHRTTRRLSLTEAGEAAVSQLGAEPRGQLRVSTPVAFGQLHVAPFLPEFLARYPDIRVEMEMSNRMVDLAQEGWDVVLRLSRSIGPNLVARSLAGVRWFLCGHEDYLRRHGEPRVPADLAGHNCLVLAQRASGEQWVFAGPTGEESVAVSGSLTVDNPETLRHALLAGVGISLLPDFVVGADIRAGRLRVLLPDHAPRSRYGDGVWAVYLSNRQLSPKVRVFIDFLLEKYGSVPYWA